MRRGVVIGYCHLLNISYIFISTQRLYYFGLEMEVKIIKSAKSGDLLRIYDKEILVKELYAPFFVKYISQIEKFTSFREEFPPLEEKVGYLYALKLLGKKAYTTVEISHKLREKRISEGSIGVILGKLSSYLNDEETLKAYIRSYLQKGKGEKAIYLKVKHKTTCTKETIFLWIRQAAPEEDMLARAKELVRKKNKTTREKAYRFLLSRGFSYDIAMQASES